MLVLLAAFNFCNNTKDEMLSLLGSLLWQPQDVMGSHQCSVQQCSRGPDVYSKHLLHLSHKFSYLSGYLTPKHTHTNPPTAIAVGIAHGHNVHAQIYLCLSMDVVFFIKTKYFNFLIKFAENLLPWLESRLLVIDANDKLYLFLF